jgi:hypothetical protein
VSQFDFFAQPLVHEFVNLALSEVLWRFVRVKEFSDSFPISSSVRWPFFGGFFHAFNVIFAILAMG